MKRKEKYRLQREYVDKLEDKNVYGFIYKITCTKNGKIYVGQTINKIIDRFDRHLTDALGNRQLDTHFARVIRKYGAENFVVEPIDHAYSPEELLKKEYDWIHKMDSTNPTIGYNESYAEVKCGGNTYRSKSDDEMAIIKQKIGSSNSGSHNGNSSAIKMLSMITGEELHFNTIKDAQTYFNEKLHITLSRRCTHRIKGLYRKEWKVAYEGHSYDETVVLKKDRYITCRRKILFKILETGEEKEFDSYRAAEKFYNLPFKTIKTKRAKLPGEKFVVNGKYEVTVIS